MAMSTSSLIGREALDEEAEKAASSLCMTTPCG